MAILGGHFAVMLIVSVPAPGGRASELQAASISCGGELGLEAIAVNAIEDLGARAPAPRT